jgi:hypothetical protein
MARSTKAEKARQINAARRLLQRGVALPEAVRRLSREFDLSERQAYRYLEEASQINQPIEIPEATVSITLTAAPDGGTAPKVCENQRSHYWGDRNRRLNCVSADAKEAWLSRIERAAIFKLMFPIRLIACSKRSSRRLTRFWSHVVSARSARA